MSTGILLIEDDHQLSEALGDFFEYVEGWQVFRAYRPVEALEILDAKLAEIDAVVLDIMMPPDEAVDEKKSDYGQDTGILLLDRMELITKNKIAIVILSARQDLDHLRELGRVQEYLQKTLTPEEISAGIRVTLERFASINRRRDRGGDGHA